MSGKSNRRLLSEPGVSFERLEIGRRVSSEALAWMVDWRVGAGAEGRNQG